MTSQLPRRAAPIISPRSATLLSLAVTMTVMCYLAGLAMAGLLMVNQAVDSWNKGLSQEITIQVKVLNAVDIDQELGKATTILQRTAGVLKVEILDRSEGVKLLEPWLGKENLDDLPIPRLIRVTIDQSTPPDYALLQQKLHDNVKGAVLDTHGRWREELSRAGTKLSALAIAILGLISSATITLAAFGARAALEANREVVEVLRLVGAENGYIARQINQSFLRLGLAAGLLGFLLTLLTLFILGWLGEISHEGLTTANIGLLSSSWGVEAMKFSYLLLVPILSAVLVTLSARITLIRLLRSF